MAVDIEGLSEDGKLAFLVHPVRLTEGEFAWSERWGFCYGQADTCMLFRINWSGAALAAFYAAVRQALVVAIIIRALATTFALGGVGWWVYQHWYSTTV